MADFVAPAGASTIIAGLAAVGVSAFWDTEEGLLIAHPVDISKEEVFRSQHVTVSWDADEDTSAVLSLEPVVWEPDGLPDYFERAYLPSTPADCPAGSEVAHCAGVVADWFAGTRQTAGDVLLAALAEYGITKAFGRTESYLGSGDRVAIPLPLPSGGAGELSIADRNGSLRQVPSAHTGWSIVRHDVWGEPIGDPLFITGGGELVDCAADSAAAAAFVADLLTAPPKKVDVSAA
ncbi:hypothetical protein [Streptomyces sp. NPDC004267]|uniref:hypothetical protein n=1 Tax=Streptomyces sp. NPDC004267 TaxID=3364694 RepID=UPI0036CD7033